MLEVQIKTKLPENCTLATLNGIMKSCIVKVEASPRERRL